MAANMAELLQPVSHKVKNPKRDTGFSIWKIALIEHGPSFSNKELSTAQKAGIQYEKRVCEYVKNISLALGWDTLEHQWISYNNSHAQPDLVIISPSGSAILFEIKQTYTDTSNQRDLYTTLLKHLGFGPITSLTICKNLTPETPKDKIIHNINEISQDSVWPLRV